jgi:acetyltransferase-like isoleucine patch superfamily enzyme
MSLSPVRSSLLRRLVKLIADVRTPLAPHYTGWERKNFWLRLAGISISKRGVAIGSGFKCIDGHEENISIDDYAAIGHNVHVWNFDRVSLGRFCMIAADVTISNGWHDKNTFEPGSGPTTIGHGAWIGTGARIVGNVSIGDNSVVGAGSVVIRDVPANTIVVGVPARVVGVRELPERVWHRDGAYFSPLDFQLADAAEGPR